MNRNTRPTHCCFLEKVHIEIIFGDCISLGGFRKKRLLVEVTTRSYWIYGIKTTISKDVINTLEQLQEDIGGLPQQLHSNVYGKCIININLRWININHSYIIAAPEGEKISNGLVERT